MDDVPLPLPLPLRINFECTGFLLETVEAAVRAGIGKLPKKGAHKGRGTTLRPGPAMPLWNALVDQTLPLLSKRGEKVRLARVLGLPRQRINDYFVSRKASPDAERILLLLLWLTARQQGRDFAAEPAAGKDAPSS